MIKTLSRVLGKSDDDLTEPTHAIHVHVERRSAGTTIGITHMNGEELVEADDLRYSPENYHAAGLGLNEPNWRVNGYKLGLALAINYLQTKQSGLDKVWIVINEPEIVAYAKHELFPDSKKGFAGKDQMTRRAWEVVAQECRRRDIRFREQDSQPGDTSANIHFITRLQKPASGGDGTHVTVEDIPSAQAVVVPLRPAAPRLEPIEAPVEPTIAAPVEPPSVIVSAPITQGSNDAWSAWDETSREPIVSAEVEGAPREVQAAAPETPVPALDALAAETDPFTAAAEGRAPVVKPTAGVLVAPPAKATSPGTWPGTEPSAEDEPMLSSDKASMTTAAPQPAGAATDPTSVRSNKDPQEVTRLLFELMLRTAKEMQEAGDFRVDALKMIEWEALIAKADIHLNTIGRRIND